jgi:hypothetical protein
MWDLWLTMRHWDRFLSELFGFPVNIIPPRFSILMPHLGMKNRPVGSRISETQSNPGFLNRGSARCRYGFRDRSWLKKINIVCFNLLAKINRSAEKYHSLLKRALTIIIGLVRVYLQLTDHANVPWAVDIIIFMQGFPETWKVFQGFLQDKKTEKGWSNPIDMNSVNIIRRIDGNSNHSFKATEQTDW